MTTQSEHLDIRNRLLYAIGDTVAIQKLFIEENIPFVLSDKIIDCINDATAADESFSLNPSIGYRYDSSYCEYRNLKALSISELLVVFFGLFRPVFLHLRDNDEIDIGDNEEETYIGLILAFMNKRRSDALHVEMPTLPPGTVQ